MKRFWKDASPAATEGGWTVHLDGRPVRTPKRRPLALPTESLALAVAAEWQAQAEIVAPASMPLNRLAASVVDLMPDRRDAAIDQIVAFVGTDLLCYRAGEPTPLLDRYRQHWDPPLHWLHRERGVWLRVAEGMMPQAQDEAAVRAVGAMVAALDDWRLVGVHGVATATGSVVLGLMVEAAALEGQAAADAAFVEERFQRQRWGDEVEALRREARVVAEVVAAAAFLRLLG
jgi:chaperone required for assembly of F1-ATPase